MNTVRAIWPWASRGNWDHGLLMRAFTNELWPGLGPVGEETGAQLDPGGAGAVIVCPGGYALDAHRRAELQEFTTSLPWFVLVHVSDENLQFDSSVLRSPRSRTWVQCPRPGGVAGDRPYLLGWPADTRELLRDVPREAAGQRAQLWCFGGQINHDYRRALAYELSRRSDGDLFVSGGFAQGRSRKEHLATLASSAIAPCPAGLWTPDTFRLYEALEAGCLPVCNRRSPSWTSSESYWHIACGDEPFPVVDSWAELPPLLDRMSRDRLALQRAATRAASWWIGYKRGVVTNLLDDIRALNPGHPPSHAVTVLMPTSPVPGHPDTSMVEEAIRRVRSYPGLATAEVIIMVDGVRPEQESRREAYEEYKRRLVELCNWHPDFWGCWPMVFEEHTHQANMARRALQAVRTPYVFYVEHDTWPMGAIDVEGILRALARPDVHYVRLHIDDRVLDEHKHLMLDPEPRWVSGVRMLRTMMWSQRPHFAKTQWYRDIIAEFFSTRSKTMIEDVLWPTVHNRIKRGLDPWERWGLWLYTPLGGTLRSGHANGRGGDCKYPMHIVYDGDVPEGAPRA